MVQCSMLSQMAAYPADGFKAVRKIVAPLIATCVTLQDSCASLEFGGTDWQQLLLTVEAAQPPERQLQLAIHALACT
jgi:hypothetical protein